MPGECCKTTAPYLRTARLSQGQQDWKHPSNSSESWCKRFCSSLGTCSRRFGRSGHGRALSVEDWKYESSWSSAVAKVSSIWMQKRSEDSITAILRAGTLEKAASNASPCTYGPLHVLELGCLGYRLSLLEDLHLSMCAHFPKHVAYRRHQIAPIGGIGCSQLLLRECPSDFGWADSLGVGTDREEAVEVRFEDSLDVGRCHLWAQGVSRALIQEDR